MLDEVDRSDYSRAETAQIVNLMCKYSFWMLDMTNTEYIHALLEGLHQVFLRLSQEQISAFLDYKWKDAQEKNKKEAFMEFIRSDRYAQLHYMKSATICIVIGFFMVREREIFSPEEFNV